MSLYKVDENTGDLSLIAGGTLYADTPIGTIFEYGGSVAPQGYALCKHQEVSRTEYAEVFKAIGTKYGEGDGETTFNLPDKTQLKQDFTVKTQLDTWTNSLEDGSESHAVTIPQDGSYYFQIVLSNANFGKDSNDITLTEGSRLISSWGYIGNGAILTNKTIFLKAGTYTLTHICQTSGIGGTAVVSVYSTRNEVVGSYIIKVKHTPVPADFLAAVNETISENTLTPIGPNNKVATTDRLLASHSIGDNGYTFADLENSMYNTWFTNWNDDVNFPDMYGSGIFIVGKDKMTATILYFLVSTGKVYKRTRKRENDQPVWSDWELIVGISSGSANIDSTYVSGGNCTWVANGKVVTVTLNNFQTRAYSDGDHVLATGLPKPYQYVAFNAMEVSGTHTQLFSIGSDGVLKGASGTMKAGDYYQSITYITK